MPSNQTPPGTSKKGGSLCNIPERMYDKMYSKKFPSQSTKSKGWPPSGSLPPEAMANYAADIQFATSVVFVGQQWKWCPPRKRNQLLFSCHPCQPNSENHTGLYFCLNTFSTLHLLSKRFSTPLVRCHDI
eukprot:gnl/TRDRNA2_/TRDRNA2_138128_c2_seq1.p1 gnl/TRDRNA2_/TRDRNA2_138128_c2~~gnl/TRDRNA2_/TRDRNA2_138128_c2_seq1.p1  ORF type:complete len:130 (-),score=10.53 gnl/TRDRNA2_/TRDRNA2_138128_c2_seq1:12-401(-)